MGARIEDRYTLGITINGEFLRIDNVDYFDIGLWLVNQLDGVNSTMDVIEIKQFHKRAR